MTSTWLQGILVMLLTVPFAEPVPVPAHLVHLDLVLLTEITNLSTLIISFLLLLFLFMSGNLPPPHPPPCRLLEKDHKNGRGHGEAKT